MTAFVFAEVPDSHITAAIAGDEFSLIWVNYDIVYRYTMGVIALYMPAAGIPDLHRPWNLINFICLETKCSIRTVFRACHHPFALTMERYSGDIPSMAFEGKNSGWIGGLNVVQFDGIATCGCKEAFIGRDA